MSDSIPYSDRQQTSDGRMVRAVDEPRIVRKPAKIRTPKPIAFPYEELISEGNGRFSRLYGRRKARW